MLVDLLEDLHHQAGCELEIHIVESGDDGTVARAQRLFPGVAVHRPGRNVGYAAGNNIGFEAVASNGAPTLVVNPDVRIPDPRTVARLLRVLTREAGVGAVAPLIVTEEGALEYVSSLVDSMRAIAVHTGTHVPEWPYQADSRSLVWLDGACLLVNQAALDSIGGFDSRYFLIAEEVDWCLRAKARGWRLLLVRDARVHHQRSSSFAGSTKSAYYASRNEYLLFRTHGTGAWRLHWALRWIRRTAGPGVVARERVSMLRGMADALRGRWGAAPEDKPGVDVGIQA